MYKYTIKNNKVVINFAINEYKGFLKLKIQEIS